MINPDYDPYQTLLDLQRMNVEITKNMSDLSLLVVDIAKDQENIRLMLNEVKRDIVRLYGINTKAQK